MSVFETSLDVLTPLIGRPMAEICLRSASISIGKPTDEWIASDLDFIEPEIRASLGSIASNEVLDAAIAEIRHKAVAD